MGEKQQPRDLFKIGTLCQCLPGCLQSGIAALDLGEHTHVVFSVDMAGSAPVGGCGHSAQVELDSPTLSRSATRQLVVVLLSASYR